jgi:hypothetical protein
MISPAGQVEADMRHVIKLVILVPALGFLLWWGWSGNFSFNSSSLFDLLDLESFYNLELGRNNIGYARRAIKTNRKTDITYFSEESVVNLTFSGQPFLLKTSSETVFDRDGRLISAVFNLPLGGLSGRAKATVIGEVLKCELDVAGQLHEAQVPIPPTGPVLVSGVVPWLAHQSSIPLGRPIGLSLLDPVSMTYKPAELIVEDATTMSDELEIFKLTLKFMGTENIEWIDSQGRLLSQFNPGLEVGLELIRDATKIDEVSKELQKVIAQESSLPEGPLSAIINGFLANGGLDALSEAIGQGGQATPWVKAEPSPEKDSVEGIDNHAGDAHDLEVDDLAKGVPDQERSGPAGP